VKGTLSLEHMADHKLKQIPPKFTQTEKQIKVRVFDIENRNVVFTKKEFLMKHDVHLFDSIRQVKKADEVYGVIVAENEYGFIVKSFGEVKGLLTFADVKASKKSDLKVGDSVKCWVLFNKKGSGLALTLDSKKVPEQSNSEKSLKDLFPSTEQHDALCD
jgi:ribosomal protein S1